MKSPVDAGVSASWRGGREGCIGDGEAQEAEAGRTGGRAGKQQQQEANRPAQLSVSSSLDAFSACSPQSLTS